MQHKDIYIAGLGLTFGDQITLDVARTNGLISEDDADRTDQRAIRVADPAAQLTVDAAVDALAQADVAAHELGPVYHAVNAPAALEFNPAAGIASHLGINSCLHPALPIANGDQGVIDGLTAAALYLTHPTLTGSANALVSAGGARPGHYERWTNRPPLGDGAGALVLSTEPSPARLVATATRADTTLRELRKLRALTGARINDLLAAVTVDVLADAQIEHGDIKHLVTPYVRDHSYYAAVLSKTNVDQRELDRLIHRVCAIGYLGTTDLISGLDYLNPWLRDGDYVLLLAAGPASVGAALIQVDSRDPLLHTH